MSDPCRWGILGTAGIARKNWKAIANSGNAVVTAVASRTEARAQEYIDENQAQVAFATPPRAIAPYEAMLEADDIDAVYIPLPTGLRKDWVIRAAKAGKHVLSEKPCGASAADVAEMIAVCKEHGVQFMDGVMFMHSARLPQLRKVLDDGESVGQLKRIASNFSFMAEEDFLSGNIRMNSELEPLGALGDLGWYNLRFTLWAMKYANPTHVSGRILAEQGRADSPTSVPLEFSGELFFEDGVSASFYCSFNTELQQWVNLSGTHGHIAFDDFVLPYFGSESAFEVVQPHFDVDGCHFHMERHASRHAVREHSDGHPTAQEANLFRTFSDLVLSGTPDSSWGDIALQTQRVMDACLVSARQGGTLVDFS